MSYLALYRKYRPKNFDEIIGQEHISRTLSNQVRSGKISHAYLFTGSRGTGKTSTARVFARAINCLDNQNGSQCHKCKVCKALEDANNVDILEIDAASNNRVDEIRELRNKVGYTPVTCKYKVYIIDEVHMLTDSAYNALLKTLEEPPNHVVFILATTEVHKLPATILSRCMRFDFKLIDTEILKDKLLQIFDNESVVCEEEAAKAIAVAGEGSMRDTISIADSIIAYTNANIKLNDVLKVLGMNDKTIILNFADKILNKDIGGGLELINEVYNSGKNLSVFARDTATHFRDLLVAKTCREPNKILNFPNNIFELYKTQSQNFELEDLITAMQIFSSILAELKYALSPRILIENALINIIENGKEFFVKKN